MGGRGVKICLFENTRKSCYNSDDKGGQVLLSKAHVSTWLMKCALTDMQWLQSYTTD